MNTDEHRFVEGRCAGCVRESAPGVTVGGIGGYVIGRGKDVQVSPGQSAGEKQCTNMTSHRSTEATERMLGATTKRATVGGNRETRCAGWCCKWRWQRELWEGATVSRAKCTHVARG